MNPDYTTATADNEAPEGYVPVTVTETVVATVYIRKDIDPDNVEQAVADAMSEASCVESVDRDFDFDPEA